MIYGPRHSLVAEQLCLHVSSHTDAGYRLNEGIQLPTVFSDWSYGITEGLADAEAILAQEFRQSVEVFVK